MKNVKKVARESRMGTKLYYDVYEDRVNTSGRTGKYVTTLLRQNTEKEIIDAVERWKRL